MMEMHINYKKVEERRRVTKLGEISNIKLEKGNEL